MDVSVSYCDVCLFCGLFSMTLNSVGPQSVTSDYNPTDQEHVYNMNHTHRGHFVIVNNRHFAPGTGKSERSGSDVDAANLFAAFRQLGFQVDLKSNLTRHEMLRLAIDCKLSCMFYCYCIDKMPFKTVYSCTAHLRLKLCLIVCNLGLYHEC